MGQVFKAHHRRMKRLAAIKLSRPNIVQTHDAGVQRGVWYLAKEYVEECDLSAVVAQVGLGGVQPTLLARHSHTAISPALPDEDFAAASPLPKLCSANVRPLSTRAVAIFQS